MCENFEQEMNAFLTREGIVYFDADEIAPVGKRVWNDGKSAELQAPPRALWKKIIPTLDVLDWLREKVGPLHVNSGYRDAAYNRVVKGSPGSRHLAFNAIDFHSNDKTPKELAELLETHPSASELGIGTYETFVHVDTRGLFGRRAPARWVG